MNHTKTLIIAEAGVNHNGDIGMAKRLIEVAAAAGADMVKFQTFSADRLATREAPKAEYQNRATDESESQYAMLKRLELSPEMHDTLIEHCRQHGISFFSTGFDVQSVDFLLGLGVQDIKIPSGEITNLPYLRHIGRLNRRTFLSTGMSTLGEIEAAIEALEAAGTGRERITVLHCNTEYPTPMEDVNLRAMQSIGQALGVAVGYSDHTPGIEVAIAATALGASVIEKHFTLDRNLPGPDHGASLEPAELAAMVAAIRNIERALGSGVKRPSASELKNRPIARKSLVAAVDIRAGELYTPENVAVMRPGSGISPMRWDEVMGRQAPRDFSASEVISL
ncbi:N-acetylneuraminate synthase [Herbaspirillum chlorophenolicum]|uniref:N-acetylneuraminate synthase n=1 Tax=Herbaspirillum chlorophenolicum TaxID=211589 RepID=A0ABW8EW33_9BURK